MTQETDREKAERWCKMALDRLNAIHTLEEQVAELHDLLLVEREAVVTLKAQRDGLLNLIASFSHTGG